MRGADHTVFIDPQAQGVPEHGYTRDWNGYCTWMRDGHYTSQPISVSARYDRANDQYVAHLFTNNDYASLGIPVNLTERVNLWHDWVENATFEVLVNR